MKPLLVLAFISCSLACNAQDREHYVKGNFDCYIAIAKDTIHQFTPSHTDVDKIEAALLVEVTKDTNSEFSKKVNNPAGWLKTYSGLINKQQHRTISIYADFRPDKDGLTISDGQWAIIFDLNTGTFSNFRIIGG